MFLMMAVQTNTRVLAMLLLLLLLFSLQTLSSFSLARA